MDCGANQVYDVRAECPRTCTNPDGNYDCGIIERAEGCYCQDGFVLDSDGSCISADQCGCLIADLNIVQQVLK